MQMIRDLSNLGLVIALIAGVLMSVAGAQTTVESPVKAPRPDRPARKQPPPLPDSPDLPVERMTPAERKVVVNLCVRDGVVRINGWDRDEVRAYVNRGTQVAFRVQQWSAEKRPAWLSIVAPVAAQVKNPKTDECISGRAIDIDVPRGAVVNLTKSEADVGIFSIQRATVELLRGNIEINDVAGGTDATTFLGDIIVTNSGGKLSLLNHGDGNITVAGVKPLEIGDGLRIRTNSGRVALKNIEHQLLEASTISGAINYDSNLLDGGQYQFSTENGSVGLVIPAGAQCGVSALFGFGSFQTEVPVHATVKRDKSLTGRLGEKETTCSLKITSSAGVIQFKKKP